MLQQFTEEFRDHKEWIGVQWIENEGTEPCGRQVKLLDYACGPGVASRVVMTAHRSQALADGKIGLLAICDQSPWHRCVRGYGR